MASSPHGGKPRKRPVRAANPTIDGSTVRDSREKISFPVDSSHTGTFGFCIAISACIFAVALLNQSPSLPSSLQIAPSAKSPPLARLTFRGVIHSRARSNAGATSAARPGRQRKAFLGTRSRSSMDQAKATRNNLGEGVRNFRAKAEAVDSAGDDGSGVESASDRDMAAQELLEWISQKFGEKDGHASRLSVRSENRVRGVFTNQEIKKGEVILRVPLKLGIIECELEPIYIDPDKKIEDIGMVEKALPSGLKPDPTLSNPSYENFWTGKVSNALLNKLFGPESGDSPHWELWRRSLPETVALPHTHFEEQDLFYTESKEVIREHDYLRRVNSRIAAALSIPTNLRDSTPANATGSIAYPVRGPNSGRPGGLEWALNIVSSRAFDDKKSGFGHYMVPGVDLCNHAYGDSANAVVEADLVQQDPSKSSVRLIANRDIKKGEEVFFTYSRMPNEVFFLYYGFVPENNPYDKVVLFEDIREVLTYCVGPESFLGSEMEEQGVNKILMALSRGRLQEGSLQDAKPLTEDDFLKLTIGPDGIDGRLASVLQAACKIIDKKKTPGTLLIERIKSKMLTFSTTIGEDLYELESIDPTSPKAQALKLRISKKQICENALNALVQMEEQSKQTQGRSEEPEDDYVFID